MSQPSFLVLAANTPWVYALAQNLAPHGAVTAVRMLDWANDARLKPQWPETASDVRRVPLTMPPGYAGRLEALFRPWMRHAVDRERSRLRQVSGSEPFVICPYPFIAPWIRHIPGDRIVYYNLDDYALYDARRVERNRALEGEIVRRAVLSICLSQHQVDALRARHPDSASRIRHFPLGVVEAFLNPEPEKAPVGKTVGYVGNMSDRVDWHFVAEVARRVPEATFHFVGNADDGPAGVGSDPDGAWIARRTEALGLANVAAEGPVAQGLVPLHYWNYAVNWMPYDVAHPFNIASCPTKLMDALASGRPFLSTGIPEARLYPDRIHVVATIDEAATKLRDLLASAASHDARAQVEYSRTQSWPHRAREFLDLLAAAPSFAP